MKAPFAVPFARGGGLPTKAPVAVGMSSERLEKIDHVIERGIAAGGYPGAAVVVGRRGAAVWEKGFGRLSWESSSPNVDAEQTIYKPRERSTSDLLSIDFSKDAYAQLTAGRFRAELNDRFSTPLFPLACMMIAFAALGAARTTRQGRGLAMVIAVVAIVALRITIFSISSLVVRYVWAVPLVYLVPLATMGLCGVIAFRPDLPRRLFRRRATRATPPLRTAPAS